MKKFVILVAIFITTITSCSIESDDSETFFLEVLPVESIDVPEQFIFGEVYEISMTYNQPTSCYDFSDFIYEINGQERTIAIVNTVFVSERAACVTGPEEVTASFNFEVTSNETYYFKFFQGENEEGEEMFEVVEIPVVDGRNAVSSKKDNY
ncbi:MULTISPECIES: hypothetical protein [Winogradskyella]|uniref:Lipoprotein n=1 Tax=Winogradskyella ouciana TaxID=2608631 RepID=A0A7K1GD81_9FLAO|nr:MULTISPECIES: hypothetical protein [Winogradskyella]MBO6879972.1 hypothetical protein [Winogradskyella sp.]MTE27256.1 hypothetical protein [Winogradskyella ouciana]